MFDDPAWGEERASIQIEGGVDVLTGFGGNTAQGAFLEAAKKGIPIISAEEDLYFYLPDVKPVLITSIINDPNEILGYLVLQASQGEILAGPFAGQIALTPFHGPDKQLENEAESILQDHKNGDFEIELPDRE